MKFCLLLLLSISTVAAMFLPYRLLAIELKRSDCWKPFLQYQKSVRKCEVNRCRIHFLDSCKKADVIPRFLRFRIPNNGCFDDNSVWSFQKKLLSQEIIKAKVHQTKLKETLEIRRTAVKDLTPENALPSIAVFIRHEMVQVRKNQNNIHNKKLHVFL